MGLSVLIACVLGFLVLYANGFLIRRRKQEFGTYLMLGMNPRSVSAIVRMETAAVGLVSLVVGVIWCPKTQGRSLDEITEERYGKELLVQDSEDMGI